MRSPRKAILLAALALLIGATSQGHAQADLTGRWIRDTEASTPMSTIVEDGMARLGRAYRVWPISGQAKKRLQETNRPHAWMVITSSGDQVTIQSDRFALTTPRNGVLEDWERSEGDLIDITTRWQGQRLEQVFEAEDGRRVNVYTLGPDGALHLDVTVTSPKLSRPLTYRMVYRR